MTIRGSAQLTLYDSLRCMEMLSSGGSKRNQGMETKISNLAGFKLIAVSTLSGPPSANKWMTKTMLRLSWDRFGSHSESQPFQ